MPRTLHLRHSQCNMSRQAGLYLRSELFSDLILLTEDGQTVSCHQSMLVPLSPLLSSLLSSLTLYQGHVHTLLTPASLLSIQYILQLVYTGEVSLVCWKDMQQVYDGLKVLGINLPGLECEAQIGHTEPASQALPVEGRRRKVKANNSNFLLRSSSTPPLMFPGFNNPAISEDKSPLPLFDLQTELANQLLPLAIDQLVECNVVECRTMVNLQGLSEHFNCHRGGGLQTCNCDECSSMGFILKDKLKLYKLRDHRKQEKSYFINLNAGMDSAIIDIADVMIEQEMSNKNDMIDENEAMDAGHELNTPTLVKTDNPFKTSKPKTNNQLPDSMYWTATEAEKRIQKYTQLLASFLPLENTAPSHQPKSGSNIRQRGRNNIGSIKLSVIGPLIINSTLQLDESTNIDDRIRSEASKKLSNEKGAMETNKSESLLPMIRPSRPSKVPKRFAEFVLHSKRIGNNDVKHVNCGKVLENQCKFNNIKLIKIKVAVPVPLAVLRDHSVIGYVRNENILTDPAESSEASSGLNNILLIRSVHKSSNSDSGTSKSSKKRKDCNSSRKEALKDTDPRHPTSSFNLRLKGRTKKGSKRLSVMGPLVNYRANKLAESNIINDGTFIPKQQIVDDTVIPNHRICGTVMPDQQLDSIVIPTRQVGGIAIHTQEVGVKVIPTNQADGRVIPLQQVHFTVIPTHQVDDTVICTKQADIIISAHQVDDTVIPTQQYKDAVSTTQHIYDTVSPMQEVDSTLTHDRQVFNTNNHTHQVDETLTHTQQVDDTLTHTNQVDDTLTPNQQVDNTLTHIQKVDNTLTYTHQVDNTLNHTQQIDATVTSTKQAEDTVIPIQNLEEQVISTHKDCDTVDLTQKIDDFLIPSWKVVDTLIPNPQVTSVNYVTQTNRYIRRKSLFTIPSDISKKVPWRQKVTSFLLSKKKCLSRPSKREMRDTNVKNCSVCRVQFITRKLFLMHCHAVHHVKFRTKLIGQLNVTQQHSQGDYEQKCDD